MNRRHRLESETPLLPELVAQRVLGEAERWLEVRLPDEWTRSLARRAAACYQRNPRFRYWLRRPGNAGREWLYAFMRHWLSALILRNRPHLYRALPFDYCVGAPLKGRLLELNK
ncbi:MAG TPA: hypothetical protein VKX17_05265 [Planctomycetota bacterium]|nr:hypothetical protein [Planctomycetota bacterium]